jgi:hypothetical protein
VCSLSVNPTQATPTPATLPQAQQTLQYALTQQVAQKQAALARLREQAAGARKAVLALTQQLTAAGSDVAESMPRGPHQQQAAVGMEEG